MLTLESKHLVRKHVLVLSCDVNAGDKKDLALSWVNSRQGLGTPIKCTRHPKIPDFFIVCEKDTKQC